MCEKLPAYWRGLLVMAIPPTGITIRAPSTSCHNKLPVEEHHDPASRGSDDQQPERLDAGPDNYGTPDADDPRGHEVELALAPELAPGQVAGLEGVGGEPGDVVHDADVGREQYRETGNVEEVLEPEPYFLAEHFRLCLQEFDAPWISVGSFAKDRGNKHREADKRCQPYDDEGQELLPVGDLPPAVPAAQVLLVYLERVPGGRPGLLFPGDGGDDAGDVDSHAHALVPDVVALAEVVGAACAGEGYRPQDRRDPYLVYVPGEVRDTLWGLGDDPVQADRSVAMTIASPRKAMMMTTSTISTLSMVL